MAIRTIKYVTKHHLIECANRADEWDFNRALDPSVGSLPDFNFPVIFNMVHNHRRGEECEEHMRIVVTVFRTLNEAALKKETAMQLTFDVPLEYYEELPEKEVEVPDK